MAFEQQTTDKTQQSPAHTDGGNSLYDQIMSGPPTAAVTPDAGVKTATQDVPPPGAPAATQDRAAVPATDQVVAPNGDTPVAPGQTAVVDTTGGATTKDASVPMAAPTGDTPAAPGQTAAAPTGDTPAAPGQTAAAPTSDTPAAPGQTAAAPTSDTPAAPGQTAAAPTGDTPAAPGQTAAAPTGDTPAAPGQPAVGDNTTGTVGPSADVPAAPGQPAVAPPVEGVEDKGNCNFKPDYEYKTEQGKAWHAESELQRQKPIVLNENGRYVVTHGDCLETIAERNLKDSGLPSDRKAIKAEVADIVAANHNRYPSLDCNNEFVRDGWKLTLPQHHPGDAPRQPDAPQQPSIDGQAPPRADEPADRPQTTVEVPPQRDSGGHHHRGVEGSGNIVIEQAGNVTIYEGRGDGRGDAPRAVPSTRPYYSQNQDRPVYNPDRPVYNPDRRYSGDNNPVYRDNRQVFNGDGDYQDPRYNGRPPIVIDGRYQTNNDGWSPQSSWNQSSWGQQDSWNNSYDSRYQQPNYGWQPYQPDYGWQSQIPRIALDFGHNFRGMGRSIPHFGGHSMPYYGGGRGGYRGGSGLSIQFGI